MVIPGIVLFIIVFGLFEKVKIYDLFIEGVKEGTQIVLNLFPTLIALMLAVDLLRTSGFIDFLINIIEPVFTFLRIPKQISILTLLRPISGSSCIAFTTELFKQYGINSQIGILATVIMGSTETSLYTLSVYTSKTKKKMSPKLVMLVIAGNFLSVILSIAICKIIRIA